MSIDGDGSLLVPHLRTGEDVLPMLGSDGELHPIRWGVMACGRQIYHTLVDELSTTDREGTRCQECYDAS